MAPRSFSTAVSAFPKHFSDTACVFLLADGRCGLQALSEAQGLHPWYHKPIKCWLHPVSTTSDSEDIIWLQDETTDQFRLPGYDGYVSKAFCGRTDLCGRPAHEVLHEELNFLGAIIGRDLESEIQESLSEAYT